MTRPSDIESTANISRGEVRAASVKISFIELLTKLHAGTKNPISPTIIDKTISRLQQTHDDKSLEKYRKAAKTKVKKAKAVEAMKIEEDGPSEQLKAEESGDAESDEKAAIDKSSLEKIERLKEIKEIYEQWNRGISDITKDRRFKNLKIPCELDDQAAIKDNETFINRLKKKF